MYKDKLFILKCGFLIVTPCEKFIHCFSLYFCGFGVNKLCGFFKVYSSQSVYFAVFWHEYNFRIGFRPSEVKSERKVHLYVFLSLLKLKKHALWGEP